MRVVIVGGGFAGLEAAKALDGADVEVTLIDRNNHHLFQPLLYEVATAALAPGSVAMPLRRIFRKQKNVRVLLDEVRAVDLKARRLTLADSTLDYDRLVLATGAAYHYFGNDDWVEHAPGLKTIEDAVEIRERFLMTFEEAEQCDDPAERRRLMTTVIVGGGPTGIELAGTMAEVARHVLRGDFRRLDTAEVRIVLIEAGERLLGAFPEESSERARADLEDLGVEIHLGREVVAIDADGVQLGDGERVEAHNAIWAAGVRGAAPELEGADDAIGRGGKIAVEPDLSLAGHPEVFVVGDLAHVEDDDGEPVPALAPAAMQMGKYVGKRIAGKAPERFSYRDKGILATIGRGKAVAAIGKLRFGGVVAWLMWVFIHILFLIGFRNRLIVLINWAYAYLTFHRGSRLITHPRARRTTGESR